MKGVRPTADRVRETLFNVLGQFFDGQRVLDLYAGTGALALEALSRGASAAVLVDSSRDAVGLCRRNVEALGFASVAEVWPMTVSRALEKLGRERRQFELVFADPPYAAAVVEALLAGVSSARVIVPGGVLLLEHDKREPSPPLFEALTRFDQRRFGDTVVSFYRAS